MFKFLKPAPTATKKVPKEKVKSSYLWHQTGVLLAICIGYIGYYVIRLIFTTEQKSISQVYGLSTAQLGLVMSCFGVGYAISKLFLGALSDKSNPNHYLATGLIISAILNFGLGLNFAFFFKINNRTVSLVIIMALMLIMSMAQGMGAAPCQKLVQLWWGKKHRGTVYSVWSSAHNAGAAACVAVIQLATWLFHGSIPWVFYTGSIVALIIAAFVLITGSDRPASVGLPTIAEHDGDAPTTKEGKIDQEEITSLTLPQIFVKYILKNKLVWAITLTSMSLYLVRYGVMSWIPSYLTDVKGFNDSFAKWLIGIFEIAAVPGVILLGAVSDFLKGRRAIVCIGCVIGLIACLSIYFFASNHTLIVVILMLMGTLIYAPLTLVGLMVNEAVPKFAVGSSTGFMGFFQYLFGETLATALIGILVSKFGWLASNVVLYSAAGLALLLLIYIMIKEKSNVRMQNK
ncbi:MFS transporter [Lactobacillus rodentium]|uniref:Glycerol-3-phosphate transporter n=1 Tax=Lactobacillus rodentium TaxID=947835 RepID=A0A2Z6T767_9LACO|nr:MFS transporter [Lactobacillus rodentium]MCR1894571.1 MFS transporter [Lactobacillus rodentium]GBG04956.1 glycerol-3-phosphate transporter [Lactobacillus rodentium]